MAPSTRVLQTAGIVIGSLLGVACRPGLHVLDGEHARGLPVQHLAEYTPAHRESAAPPRQLEPPVARLGLHGDRVWRQQLERRCTVPPTELAAPSADLCPPR